MAEELKEKLKEKSDKVSGQIRNRKRVIFGSLGVAVLLVGLLTFSSLDFAQGSFLDNKSDVEDGYTEPEIEGEIVEIVVDDERAQPFRPEISEEDGIRFVNDASYDLNFTFDREVDSFVVEQNKSRVVDVDSIVYFYVNPVQDVEFRQIKGGVNVQ